MSNRPDFHKVGANDGACLDSCPCKGHAWSSSIWTASEQNDIESVQLKLNRSIEFAKKADKFGYTPLHLAAQHNNIAIIRLLLANGADVNADACGATPLHRAACAGSAEACQMLLDAGADVNVVDVSFGDRRTPLHKAASIGHAAIMNCFRSYGGDSTHLDANEETADQVYQRYQQEHNSCDIVNTEESNSYCMPCEQPVPKPSRTLTKSNPDTDMVNSCEGTPGKGGAEAVATNTLPPSSPPTSRTAVEGLPCYRCGKCCLSFTRIAGQYVCKPCSANKLGMYKLYINQRKDVS